MLKSHVGDQKNSYEALLNKPRNSVAEPVTLLHLANINVGVQDCGSVEEKKILETIFVVTGRKVAKKALRSVVKALKSGVKALKSGKESP